MPDILFMLSIFNDPIEGKTLQTVSNTISFDKENSCEQIAFSSADFLSDFSTADIMDNTINIIAKVIRINRFIDKWIWMAGQNI